MNIEIVGVKSKNYCSHVGGTDEHKKRKEDCEKRRSDFSSNK